MKVLFGAVLVTLLVSVGVAAQTLDQLQWEKSAPDLAAANSYVYRLYKDGAPIAAACDVRVNNITMCDTLTATCVPGVSAGNFICTAPIPAMTPGRHDVVVTALDPALGLSSQSGASNIVGWTLTLSAPTNLLIIRKP